MPLALSKQRWSYAYGATPCSAETMNQRETVARQSTETDSSEAGNKAWTIFPFEVPLLAKCLPGPFTKIVSLPHLVVWVALFSALALLVETIVRWKQVGCHGQYCQGRITSVTFVSLCGLYFCKTIWQYDADLQQKQRALQKATRALKKVHQEMVEDLEGFLSKSLESQVTLAERGFESHRRDFMRFLRKYGQQLIDSEANDGTFNSGASLDVFRCLVDHWLAYFSEASIDPIEHPSQIIEKEELDKCISSAEVAAIVSARLECAAVQFVSTQRAKDVQEISLVVQAAKKASGMRKKACAFMESFRGKKEAEEHVENGVALDFDTDFAQDHDEEMYTYRWVHWGLSASVGMRRSSNNDSDGALPVDVPLCCVTVTLLSLDHIYLILSFFVGLGILIFELFFITGDLHQWSHMIETIICLVCIVFILRQFVDMDIITLLDKQLRQLEAEQAQMLLKREKIMTFYNVAQDLGDVWLHHTIPQLELLKCFYEGLWDAPAKEHTRIIGLMDHELKALKQITPPLEQWRGKEAISTEAKIAFDKAIMDLVHKQQQSRMMLSSMPECRKEVSAAFGKEVVGPAGHLATRSTQCIGKPVGIVEGSSVEYLSNTFKRWVPARVLRVDAATGLLDLDLKEKVEPDKVRLLRHSGKIRSSTHSTRNCEQQ